LGTIVNATVQHRTATAFRTLWVLGDRVTVLGPVAGADLITAEVFVPPGSGTPLHTHASPETFHVLDGMVTFATAPDEPKIARPGDMVTVPANAPHGYRNTGTAPARMLVTFAPSLLAFFEAVGSADAPPPGPPPADAVTAVMRAAAQHGIRMVEAV
jgi:quercetin dioxygenase-like cupin family protein